MQEILKKRRKEKEKVSHDISVTPGKLAPKERPVTAEESDWWRSAKDFWQQLAVDEDTVILEKRKRKESR